MRRFTHLSTSRFIAPARRFLYMTRAWIVIECHPWTLRPARSRAYYRHSESNHPWPPPLLQVPATNFWNTAAASGRSFPVLSPETSQSGDMTSLGAATGVPRPGRTLSWDGGVAASARTGSGQSCPPCRSRNPACNEPGRLASAPGSAPVRTRRRHPRHATEKPRRRILEVRIQPLVTAMNRMLFFSDVAKAVHQ